MSNSLMPVKYYLENAGNAPSRCAAADSAVRVKRGARISGSSAFGVADIQAAEPEPRLRWLGP
jgi:hypothetical protein